MFLQKEKQETTIFSQFPRPFVVLNIWFRVDSCSYIFTLLQIWLTAKRFFVQPLQKSASVSFMVCYLVILIYSVHKSRQFCAM